MVYPTTEIPTRMQFALHSFSSCIVVSTGEPKLLTTDTLWLKILEKGVLVDRICVSFVHRNPFRAFLFIKLGGRGGNVTKPDFWSLAQIEIQGLQGGPLPIISGVISPINGLINPKASRNLYIKN